MLERLGGDVLLLLTVIGAVDVADSARRKARKIGFEIGFRIGVCIGTVQAWTERR